jgi:hypothetical protein
MTNKIWWKIAKKQIGEEFLKKLMGYNPSGSKAGEYRRYHLLNFIERNIEGLVAEEVEQVSVLLAKLLKWLQLALLVRKEDIVKRKSLKRREKEDREQKIQQKQERDEKKVADLQKAIEDFEEERKEDIEAY